MLTYYDSTHGRDRFKRRYTWAAWAFLTGVGAGLVLAHLI
jgi:hypothetical protein